MVPAEHQKMEERKGTSPRKPIHAGDSRSIGIRLGGGNFREEKFSSSRGITKGRKSPTRKKDEKDGEAVRASVN